MVRPRRHRGRDRPVPRGWLVEYASWRWAFLVNVPLAVATVWIARVAVPESRDDSAAHRFDVAGALLATAALAVSTSALIQYESLGPTWSLGLVASAVLIGVAFGLTERRSAHPMMQPSLFASRQFTAANAMTLLVYAALGAVFSSSRSSSRPSSATGRCSPASRRSP